MDQTGAAEASPPVGVVLTAYNHLDYTKQCVDSLFRNTPQALYELITVDNGSSDGTREYLEGLPNGKKIFIPDNIGVDRALNLGFGRVESKYALLLSNDILLTPNWLENLIACIASDDKAAMAVPVCNFSSNNQQAALAYNTLGQLQQAAGAFNRSNPLLWEERLRLVTYVCLFRADALRAAGFFDEDFSPGSYDDDAISFTLRRSGHRLLLAADTYVHHYGSVTFNEEYAKGNFAARNRELFARKFGVDSWAAAWIDFNVVGLADYGRKGPVDVLGVGRTSGSTLLQVKNMYRKKGVTDVFIDYLSEGGEYLTDLATVCRDCACAPLTEAGTVFSGRAYDLIVVESDTDKLADAGGLMGALCGRLKPGGQVIATAAESTLPAILEAMLRNGFATTRMENSRYYGFSRFS